MEGFYDSGAFVEISPLCIFKFKLISTLHIFHFTSPFLLGVHLNALTRYCIKTAGGQGDACTVGVPETCRDASVCAPFVSLKWDMGVS